jgi:hypothetical protein
MDEPPVRPWEQEKILGRLESVVPILHESAEAATQAARLYLESLEPPVGPGDDPYFHAHATRFHLGRALRARGQESDIDKQWLANSGVAFRLDWIDVRMLKSANGELPPPGGSRIKRAFYRQEIELVAPLWEIDKPNGRADAMVNLVVTWDIDGRGNLTKLVAYSPSRGGWTASSVGWFWKHELLHPALTFTPPPVFGEPAPDIPGYDRKVPAKEIDAKAQ